MEDPSQAERADPVSPLTRTRLKRIKPVRAAYYALRYYRFRLTLWRQARREARVTFDEPVPPPALRHRVHGGLDPASFRATGADIAADIVQICHDTDVDLGRCEAILDFGCGSGRVLRNFLHLGDEVALFGTDIDAELVAWCRANLAGVDWSLNDIEPPTGFADDSFDLIYAISVFSHLDEALQMRWLEELRRIMKPGGIGVFSVHGPTVIDALPDAERRPIEEHGFGFEVGATGRHKLDRLPDFYQTAYHTPDYVARTWGRVFEIVAHRDRAVHRHQDAVVVRKAVGAAS